MRIYYIICSVQLCRVFNSKRHCIFHRAWYQNGERGTSHIPTLLPTKNQLKPKLVSLILGHIKKLGIHTDSCSEKEAERINPQIYCLEFYLCSKFFIKILTNSFKFKAVIKTLDFADLTIKIWEIIFCYVIGNIICTSPLITIFLSTSRNKKR